MMDAKHSQSNAINILESETKKIKSNQAKYYRLLNAIHEVYYSTNIEGNVTEISPSIGTVAGYDCEKIIGLPVTTFYKHPEDRENFIRILQAQQYVTDYELELIHKDGHAVHISANAHMIFDEVGNFLGVEGLLRDISDRVKLEKELQQLNDDLELRVAARTAELEAKNLQLLKFSRAIEQAAEGFIITDCSGKVEYVNHAFERINGYAAEEVIGQSLSILQSGKHDADFFYDLWSTLRRGEVWEGTIINRRKNGHEYPALMNIVPIKDNGETVFYAAIQQDMSEYQMLESQFQQAQKMEAIGTLVGGISHDFNNMLAAMLMHMFMLKRDISSGKSVSVSRVEKAEKIGHQASDVLKNLLVFSRSDQQEKASLELNTMLQESSHLLRLTIPSKLKLELDICDEALSVMGDVTQLQQMLMNLLNNGRDALQDCASGCIRVTLRSCQPDAALIVKHPELDGVSLAELTVEDNGSGMDEATTSRIFEPFFTTKPAGHGTGLGLVMVYGCIQNHDGILEVQSELDKGTKFLIYLPTIEKEEAFSTSERREVTELYAGDGELILVADDNETVRQGVVEALESLNYRTLQAADGMEALHLFEQQKDQISLVLFDIIMPRLSGSALSKKVREIKPDMPIMFSTGHNSNHAASEVVGIENMCICEKPFKIEPFSREIQVLLGKI